MSNTSFYKDLPTFEHFNGITNSEFFYAVPDDWKIIITDVRGSTVAIENGLYKDVNTIGVASIVTIQNVIGDLEIPFVFGGDGATVLVPNSVVPQIGKALSALQLLSEKQFDLELRIGMISVEEVVAAGGVVEVAKHELVAGRSVAVFRGGGLTLAEKKIKEDIDKYSIKVDNCGESDLQGLSCRWEPIKNNKGCIVSLLVLSRKGDAVYQNFLSELNSVLDGDLEFANPLTAGVMQYKSVGKCVKDEIRYHRSAWNVKFLLRYLEILLAVTIFKFKIPPLLFNPSKYIRSMATHSDYRKFDDTLRMVIDCSPSQLEKLKSLLERLFKEHELYYGIFESPDALMTCYVQQGIGEGGHIHFIDGGDGGYAMASRQLKAQLKENK